MEATYELVSSITQKQTPLKELSIVMPCLNEAETLEACIIKAQQAFRDNGIDGEIIIADNGSTDGSQAIATRLGARVVNIKNKGYGNALMGGIEAANSKYVAMGDADDSYDFREVPRILEKLRQGYDLVMGNRFKGGIKEGAMPPLHRYLGNPVLTFVGRLFFSIPVRDFHCGLRGFSKEAYKQWHLETTGMEFASEMVVKASLKGASITEVPVTLSPDGRSRAPHLRSWRDGWRHLHFLLIHSPRWLYIIPGVILCLLGVFLFAWILPGPRQVGGVTLDVHTLLFAAMFLIVGVQSFSFGLITRVYGVKIGLKQNRQWIKKVSKFDNTNTGLLIGSALLLIGLAGSFYSLYVWGQSSFGNLNPQQMLRLVIPLVVLVIIGAQVIMTSFIINVIGLKNE